MNKQLLLEQFIPCGRCAESNKPFCDCESKSNNGLSSKFGHFEVKKRKYSETRYKIGQKIKIPRFCLLAKYNKDHIHEPIDGINYEYTIIDICVNPSCNNVILYRFDFGCGNFSQEILDQYLNPELYARNKIIWQKEYDAQCEKFKQSYRKNWKPTYKCEIKYW